MKKLTLSVVALTLLACVGGETALPVDDPPPGAELATSWNALVLEIAEAEDGFLTLKGLRTAAMMHLAMHDALNAVEPRFATYRPVDPRPEADPLAAATWAAHGVAVAHYPDAADRLAAERDLWLEGLSGDLSVAAGEELGRSAAASLLAERDGDGWNGEAEYQWHPMGPGVYAEFNEHSGTPEGFVFGAGWAAARPFVLQRPDRFRSPPPPPIDSAAYAAAFDEVKEVGRFESPSRTADQTHLALWWKEFVEKSHNRLARELALAEDLDLWQATRLFALLNMSVYDGYVDVFENKFHYNHWRPYTAIRWAANDGNPRTEPDPEWNNTHRHTYAFPSYPSAHGTACAAAMTVLEHVLGEGYAFTMTIPEVDSAGPFSPKMVMDPPSRSFDSFDAAAEECSLSRVYLGIHFRYDSEAGTLLGKQIGGEVVAAALAPAGEGSPGTV